MKLTIEFPALLVVLLLMTCDSKQDQRMSSLVTKPEEVKVGFEKNNLEREEFRNQLEKDSTAYIRLRKGLELASRGEFDEAINYLGISQSVYMNSKNDHGNAKVEIEKGRISYHLQKFRIAIRQFRSGIIIIHDKIGIDHYLLPYCNYYLARCYFDLGKFDSSKFFIDKSIHNYENIINDSVQLANCYLLLAEIYKNYDGDYNKAESLLFKAKSIFELKNDNRSAISTSRVEFILANLYRIKGEYDKSIRYLKNVFAKRVEILRPNHGLIINPLISIGNIYFQLDKISEADTFYMEALKRIGNGANFNSTKATLYHNLGLINDEKQNYQKAIDFYYKGLEIKKELTGEYHVEVANTLMNIGLVYLHKEDYPQAKKLYEKALKIHLDLYPPTHPEIAWSVIEMGYLFASQRKFSAALRYYNQAINIIRPDSIYYSSGRKNELIISDTQILLKALEAKANLLISLHEQQSIDNNDYLFDAYHTFYEIDELINLIRREYKEEEARLDLGQRADKIYEKAIRVCFLLKQQFPDSSDKYLESIFHFMEKSKMMVLMEAQINIKAKKEAQIHVALLNKEKVILDSLGFIRQEKLKRDNQLKSVNKKSPVEKLISDRKLISTIHRLKQKHESIIRNLEIEYPQYYRLKYDYNPPSLQKVQAKLADSSTVLFKYFLGGDYLYSMIIGIDFSKLFIKKIDNEFPTLINSLRRQLSVEDIYSDWSAKNQRLAKSSSKLYQTLLKEGIELSKQKNIENIIFIPHGILGTIPFEILGEYDGEKKTKYLIENFNISYFFSASNAFHKKNENPNSVNHEILGMAFSSLEGDNDQEHFNNFNELQALLGAAREVKSLSRIYKGKFLFGDEASKEEFLKNVPSYSVVHLATHAIESSKELNLPSIYFARSDSPFVSPLTLIEIMNLELSTDLITLGACETGMGKEKKGEGIMSLAYGLSYAGAKSIITTLWPVNDHSSVKLIETFYDRLAKGESKNIALREAKLEYLKVADPLERHPAFWASYIVYGNIDPIEIKQRFNFLYMLGLLFGGGMIIYLLIKKRNSIFKWKN